MDQINNAIDSADGRDTDDDGLPDIAEFIVGTDPRNPDSDGDGLKDGVELDQGSNPLDGRPAAVGIIGSVPVAGGAVDIAAFNDRAVVALKSGGIGVFDVAAERLGVLSARLDAPGPVLNVALSQDFGVAGGSFDGLLVFDPGNPNSSLRLLPIPGRVTASAVEGGFAWVATSSALLFAVDLSTGTVIDKINVAGVATDIAVENGIATLVFNQSLQSFELFSGSIVALGEIPLGLEATEIVTGRRRINLGNGVAFVNDLESFARFDVSNPRVPVKVSGRQPYGPVSFKQIVSNGSGFGLAVEGANPRPDVVIPATHNIQVFDLRDPLVNNNAGLIISTPGVAFAASLYNGLAYVADGAAGMQIVNYLASDTDGIPPAIKLTTSSSPGRADEGQLLRLHAAVTDDVQVRVVEFYRDGEKVASDGNFPFEVAFTAPVRTFLKTNLVVRARAIDTGGNATWSEELTLELVPDATAPRLIRTTPGAFDVLSTLSSALALFSEPLDPATITPEAIQLRTPGTDGLFDTPDDVRITGYSLAQHETIHAVALTLQTALLPGRYQLSFTDSLADLAGNPLLGSPKVEFTIFDKSKDTDGDGLPDDVELLLGTNPNSTDSNGNGIPDGNEDLDGDGLSNRYEIAFGLNPSRRDTDGNGVNDGDEDRDRDGLTELREQSAGTNPLAADTDGDGWPDEAEISAGSNPLLASSIPRLMTLGQPPVEMLAPRVIFDASAGFGTTVAQPSVEILAPRVIFDASAGFGTTVAQPPVEILAPRVIFDASAGFGTTLAQPPVEILAPRVIFGASAGFGTTVAQPPVEMLAPRVISDATGGVGTTVAQPEITIEFEP